MSIIQTVVTPSGPMRLVRAQAEALLKAGVISGELDGVLHAADAAAVKGAMMASSVCDFCSAPGATHVHDVPDNGLSQIPGNMGAGKAYQGWQACDACEDLIRRD